jgi:hypothetical protein
MAQREVRELRTVLEQKAQELEEARIKLENRKAVLVLETLSQVLHGQYRPL